MNLPIDLVPNTDPPQFRWRQIVQTPIGTQLVEYVATLPPTVEQSVVQLIAMTQKLMAQNAELSQQIEHSKSKEYMSSIKRGKG